jgi:hypothetical protein
MRISTAIFLLCALTFAASTSDDRGSTPLPKVTARAIELSKVTAPGSAPFHLKAVVSEPGNRNSDYNAEIEEYWAAPDKWRRTIKAAAFSQMLVVNGESAYEQDTGDYYPFWLKNMVTALLDFMPDDFTPRSNLTVANPSAQPYVGLSGVERTVVSDSSCLRWSDKVGTPPAENAVFTTLCFVGEERLMAALFTPYFHAEFKDFRNFKHKQVARQVVANPGPGIRIEARITELSELRQPYESFFSTPQSTPDNARIHSVRVREADARKLLLNSPEIAWNPVRDGKTSGVLSMMVYVDKEGRVRETWPLDSDNPFPQAQARQEIAKWRFKPMERDGAPVQMEALLTLPFLTTVVDPIPLFADAEARKMAITKADPKFLQTSVPKGTDLTVRALVDEHGHVVRVDNPNQLSPGLFNAAESALSMWLFKPYKVKGVVQRFNADITFYVR